MLLIHLVAASAASVHTPALGGPELSFARESEWGDPEELSVPGERGTIAIWVHGNIDQGRPIVVLHGGPGACAASVAELLPIIRPTGRAVVFYDQRGTGRSSPVSEWTEVSLRTHLADLEVLRERLGQEQLDLVGHSWGGMLAAAYSQAHPGRVHTLVVLDSGGLDSSVTGGWRGISQRLENRTVVSTDKHGRDRFFMDGSEIQVGSADAVRAPWRLRDCFELLSFDVHYYHEYGVSALRHALAVCECRRGGFIETFLSVGDDYNFTSGLYHAQHSVVIYGANDSLITGVSPSIRRGDGVEFVELEQCGHRPHVECPEALGAWIERALAR